MKAHLIRTFHILLLALLSITNAQASPSIAFFYGKKPPVDHLMQFDQVVLEADHVSAKEHKAITRYGAQTFAYLSISEAESYRPYAASLATDLSLARNKQWGNDIVDVAHPTWKDIVIKRVDTLWQRGYRGFFIDTIDSYLLIDDDKQRLRQQQATAHLIRSIKTRYPDAQLLLNRGFEILDDLRDITDGLIAESLFNRWNTTTNQYEAVPTADYEWLLEKLNTVKTSNDFPVTVIDYLPYSQREDARKNAAQITKLGFTPWIASADHTRMGLGTLETLSRNVFLLYDSANQLDVAESPVHNLLAMPLEYMGYTPVYHDIRRGLPDFDDVKHSAGVASWLSDRAPSPNQLQAWYIKLLEADIPLALFGQLGFTPNFQFQDITQLPQAEQSSLPSANIAFKRDTIGYEIDPLVAYNPASGYPLTGEENFKAHLTLTSQEGQALSPILTAHWGGIALMPWVIYEDYQKRNKWILDPFKYLREVLNLAVIPAPDVTTENGRRILTTHIDGDGLITKAELPGTPLAAEVIEKQFIKRYPIPHSVSVIEGEMTSDALSADLRQQAEQVARRILLLNNVEVGSHTYSHPFDWRAMREGKAPTKGLSLPLSNYRFSLQREFYDNLDYINNTLLLGQKKVALYQLSGDCIAPTNFLKAAHDLGIPIVNGGDTEVLPKWRSLTHVSPMSRVRSGLIQVYAPISNENIYTNNWTGPFDGYRNVINTFTFTESPRRLKPINIYYHFYSGNKPAAIKALKEVYQWAMSQEYTPLFFTEYAAKVHNYPEIGIARTIKGGRWQVTGASAVKTLRLPKEHTALEPSQGVAGYRALHDGLYVHLDGSNKVQLQPSGASSSQVPALKQSNGVLQTWQPLADHAVFHIKGHQPLVMEFHATGKKYCQLKSTNIHKKATVKKGVARFTLTGKDTANAEITCH